MPDLSAADIHDSRQDKTRTYEEIRAELIREHGEALVLLLLKEVSQADYLRMIQADLLKQTDKARPDIKDSKEAIGIVESDGIDTEVREGMEVMDVAPAHSLAPDSPDQPIKTLQ